MRAAENVTILSPPTFENGWRCTRNGCPGDRGRISDWLFTSTGRQFTFSFCVFLGVLKLFVRTRGHLTDCTDEQAGKSPHCPQISRYAFSCSMHHICSVDMHTLYTWHETLSQRWNNVDQSQDVKSTLIQGWLGFIGPDGNTYSKVAVL